MSNPQHLAEQSTASRVSEHVAAGLAKVGIVHNGFGTHRADAKDADA